MGFLASPGNPMGLHFVRAFLRTALLLYAVTSRGRRGHDHFFRVVRLKCNGLQGKVFVLAGEGSPPR